MGEYGTKLMMNCVAKKKKKEKIFVLLMLITDFSFAVSSFLLRPLTNFESRNFRRSTLAGSNLDAFGLKGEFTALNQLLE